jgi:hypothetical protein
MSNGFMYGTPTGTPLFKFDIENSSGTSVGGGEVWKGTQVLSNNNYTVTWTREFSAPNTEGTYSVLVYSAGAAADYIYCKMQMNGRTNGPKTSLVVAATVVPTTTTSTTSTTSTTTTTIPITTTTSTTIPPLPESPASLDRETPSQPVVLVGGVVTTPEVLQSPSSITVTAGGVEVSVGAVTDSNNKVALTPDGVVPVSSRDNLSLEIGGYVPATKVDVWLYSKSGSDPRYLRSFTVSSSGTASLEIELPDDVASGAGDVVISGSNKFGKRVTVAVPVQITAMTKSSGFTSSLLAGSLFAIGGFFIFLVRRRREEETALN